MRTIQPIPIRRRLVPLGLLLLHMVVAGLAPLADASIESRAPDGVVHVESEDRPACPTGHDHLQCQFCRHMGLRLLAMSAAARAPDRAFTWSLDAPIALTNTIHPRLGSPLGSRAPPHA